MGANIDKNRMLSKENNFLTAFRKSFVREKTVYPFYFCIFARF